MSDQLHLVKGRIRRVDFGEAGRCACIRKNFSVAEEPRNIGSTRKLVSSSDRFRSFLSSLLR